MTGETRIELHGPTCSCRGGAWVLLETTAALALLGEGGDKLVLGLAEWRQLGKPAQPRGLPEAQDRVESGDRRQFHRFEVSLPGPHRAHPDVARPLAAGRGHRAPR